MKPTVVLALDDSYRGLPSLPKNAQTWTIVINSLNDGYAYNFTATRANEIIYSRSEHAELRAAFALTRLGSYTNSIEVDGRVTFIANSLCVTLRRFMLGESRRVQGVTIPAHIAIKFCDGPFFDMNTAFNVEVENVPRFLRPGPSTTQSLHEFIDMATYFLKIEIPSQKPLRRTEPMDEDPNPFNDRVGSISLSTIPFDKEAYYSVSSNSPLFDACATAHLRCDVRSGIGEDDTIVQALLHSGRGGSAVSTALVIAHDATGKYEFDEHYNVGYIDMPSTKELTVDTRQKCKLAAYLRDSGRRYAALKIGAPSQFSTSLEQEFMSTSVDHIDVLPSLFFSHNPRFIEMVSARYDKLKEFCHDTTTDAPETMTSLFFSPAVTVLLRSLMGFRNSWNEFDPYDEKRGYHRMVLFEAMATLCSIPFFLSFLMKRKYEKDNKTAEHSDIRHLYGQNCEGKKKGIRTNSRRELGLYLNSDGAT
ncbi:hypothetical protein BPAE_0097g00010 [Botrytis paeoniae]|uniref:Uncharacterized protein n=1 Tax=Botrytis paeoniae TaxID=278948 RepID=A0A4Z1FQC4_9HELO|nr:hypothetical protein BPAE_0097g00010 [Botrytis paeoniae]